MKHVFGLDLLVFSLGVLTFGVLLGIWATTPGACR